MNTIEQALSKFLFASEADGLKASTRKWYGAMLKDFAAKFYGRSIESVTTDELRQVVIDIKRVSQSQTTAADRVVSLHRFWSWTAAEYGITNPMARIRHVVRPEPLPKAPTVDHVQALIAAIDNTNPQGRRDMAMLMLTIDACLRISEVLSLNVDDIDFYNRHITIRNSKFGKSRGVPFTESSEHFLLAWLKVRRSGTNLAFCGVSNRSQNALTYSGARQILQRLHAQAGLAEFFPWHTLRHFGAKHYRLQQGDPLNLQKILGHSDISTTLKHYGNFVTTEMIAAHEQFTALNVLIEKGI